MIILAIRTDKPEAELGVFDDGKELVYEKWEAHRQLAETINKKLKEILDKSSISRQQIGGIMIYEGPGSFTGLRIGFSVANALAMALGIPVVASAGPAWIKGGITRLQAGQNDRIALPEYGSPPHITARRK